MLKRKHRLPRGIEFAKKQPFFSPLFTLRVKDNELGVSRFGFIVSKKVEKRAVLRNRIKRQIRNCMEKNLDAILTGKDMLFVLKKESKEKSKDEFCRETLNVLKKRGFLK